MKAVLEFDLDDADDRRRHRQCVYAEALASALWEIAHNVFRHAEDVEPIRQRVFAEIEGVGVDIDDLVE